MLVGIAQLVVKMRSARAATVAAKSKKITSFDWNYAFFEEKALLERLARKLFVTDIFPDGRIKTVKMRINRHKPIIMSDIHHITIAPGRHSDTAHVAIGNCINALSNLPPGLNIDTRMKRICAKLAKSG